MSSNQFTNVRVRTVKFVTTFDLVMACAYHHNIEGETFRKQIMPFYKEVDRVHSIILNSDIDGCREAAAWNVNTSAGAVDINLLAYFVCKDLASRGEDAAVLSSWFNDIFEQTKAWPKDHPLTDCFVIVNKLPPKRDVESV